MLMIGCAAYPSAPSAHADATYGPGYYAVPGQLPYGVYTAGVDMGDFKPTCSFSLWTSAGEFISGDSVTPNNSLTANIQAPAVAKFITHGCTPWTKVD